MPLGRRIAERELADLVADLDVEMRARLECRQFLAVGIDQLKGKDAGRFFALRGDPRRKTSPNSSLLQTTRSSVQ